MRKIWKSWTFWFIVAAFAAIVLSLLGIDDIGLYIGLNPILFWASSKAGLREWINGIPGLWYLLSLVTMSLYGLWFDFLRSTRKKRKA